MLDPAPQLLDREDIVLHRLAILFLILFLELRPQPGHPLISLDIWRDQADLQFMLGLVDHLAVAELPNEIFREVLAIV